MFTEQEKLAARITIAKIMMENFSIEAISLATGLSIAEIKIIEKCKK